MTPQTVFDVAILIGFGAFICMQHLTICELQKRLAIFKVQVQNLQTANINRQIEDDIRRTLNDVL